MRAIQKFIHKLARCTNTRVDESVNARKQFYPIDLVILGPFDHPQRQRSHILDGSDEPFGGELEQFEFYMFTRFGNY